MTFRPIDEAEVARRIDHAPPTAEQVAKMIDLRAQYKALMLAVVEATPQGREQSEALTHLESAQMWTNASVVRPPVSR